MQQAIPSGKFDSISIYPPLTAKPLGTCLAFLLKPDAVAFLLLLEIINARPVSAASIQFRTPMAPYNHAIFVTIDA